MVLYEMTDVKQARAEEMLARARSRAKKKKLPFNLELLDIETPDNCPVLDVPLNYTSWISRRYSGRKGDSPCLDRKEPQLGYIKGNVWTISSAANARKGSIPLSRFSSFEEFQAYIRRSRRLNKWEE